MEWIDETTPQASLPKYRLRFLPQKLLQSLAEKERYIVVTVSSWSPAADGDSNFGLPEKETAQIHLLLSQDAARGGSVQEEIHPEGKPGI
jgi:hypothetical protein